VAGLRLPFESKIRFASSVLGNAELRWSEIELGIEPPATTFEPATLAKEGG